MDMYKTMFVVIVYNHVHIEILKKNSKSNNNNNEDDDDIQLY
jgi:hypothetical protein